MKDRIKKYLEYKGYHVDVCDTQIITIHQILSREVKIAGELPEEFPFCLPRLYLLERNKYGSLAHIGWNLKNDLHGDKGLICEGVLINRHIDYSQPEVVYLKALENAVSTIASLIEDYEKNKIEIIKEFAAHWRFSVKDLQNHKVTCFLEPSSSVFEVIPRVSHDPLIKGNTFFIKEKNTELNPDYDYITRIKKKSTIVGKAIYLPIEKPILPPSPTDTIFDWWINLLKQLPHAILQELRAISRHKKTKIFWIISSVLIDSNTHSWFCIKFENTKKTNPPLKTKNNKKGWNALAYKVQLHNKEYIKPRGGALKVVGNKAIAIVGCGSVGAEVARQLASAGIEKLILIDYDSLTIENIYRHTLSSKYIDFPKSKALAIDLNNKYPYLKAESSSLKYLRDCLDESFLSKVNGIIVATGNPTEERYFNEQLVKRQKKPWVIYVWVEGHGIGGHAVYVHSHGKGCLNCLYRDEHGNKSLNSIQNFLKSEQNIAIDIAGCGTHFLPYSYTDAIQTAILATRLALNSLQKKLTESCRLSWKGPNYSNLTTTYRYKHFNKSLIIEPLFWDECDVCNV